MNIFRIAGKCMITIAGSIAEGMRGGIYSDERNGDDDLLFRNRKIKLYTPRENNIDNPPLLPLHDNEDYTASFFVVEYDNFSGYVKLSLMDGNCTNMNDDKLYLPKSMGMDFLYLTKPSTSSIPSDFHTLLDACQKRDINGPSHTVHHKKRTRITKSMDVVYFIQYDTWPDSAKSFITRRRRNNWPSNNLLENIKSKGCNVIPVGHHESK